MMDCPSGGNTKALTKLTAFRLHRHCGRSWVIGSRSSSRIPGRLCLTSLLSLCEGLGGAVVSSSPPPPWTWCLMLILSFLVYVYPSLRSLFVFLWLLFVLDLYVDTCLLPPIANAEGACSSCAFTGCEQVAVIKVCVLFEWELCPYDHIGARRQ